jgi:RNA polymerase sigma-70 factor (ECF subfamily)
MGRNSLDKQISEYVMTYRNEYYRLAYSYVGNVDDALDIIQESIYRAMAAIGSLKDSEHIEKWFYNVVVDSSLEVLRIQKKLIRVNKKALKIDKADSIANYKDEEIKSKLKEIYIPRELEIVVENAFRGSSLDNNSNNFKRIFKQIYQLLSIW